MNELIRALLFLPPAGSDTAEAVDHLHLFVIGVTMLGSFAVAAVGARLAYRYRRRPEHPAGAARPYRTPIWLEVVLIGTMFGLFVLWWGIGVGQYFTLRNPPDDAIEIYVTGKQWMWKFNDPRGHASVGTLRVPVGRPVKLVMTSRDVIHSLYLPAFRTKQDVLPGRYTTLWFTPREPGRYDILCAEYCGTEHSSMRAELVVMEPEAYQAWLESDGHGSDEDAAAVDLVRRGQEVVAAQGCLRCHTLDGRPHIGPSFAGSFGKDVAIVGGEVHVDEAYLTESMMDPLAKVRRGYDPVMPSYQGLVRPADIAAIVELIRSLRDVEPPTDAVPMRPAGADDARPGLPTPAPRVPGRPQYVEPPAAQEAP